MEKPTLHDIAAMPFPASERALKEHYGVEPWREGGPGKIWTVEVEYTWTEFSSMTVEVEADDEDEALELASKEVRKTEGGLEDFQINSAGIVTRSEQ